MTLVKESVNFADVMGKEVAKGDGSLNDFLLQTVISGNQDNVMNHAAVLNNKLQLPSIPKKEAPMSVEGSDTSCKPADDSEDADENGIACIEVEKGMPMPSFGSVHHPNCKPCAYFHKEALKRYSPVGLKVVLEQNLIQNFIGIFH